VKRSRNPARISKFHRALDRQLRKADIRTTRDRQRAAKQRRSIEKQLRKGAPVAELGRVYFTGRIG
jgi:hypothetical protein